MEYLKIEIIDASYENNEPIIKKAEIQLEKYGIYFLNGKNGSGKSTFLKALHGDLLTKVYNISLNGKKLSKYSKDIVFIDDQFVGYEFLKVHEYVIYILELFKKSKRKIDIELLLTELELQEYSHKLIKDLSQGNKQKLSFLATILIDGKIILFDEAFEHVDKEVMHLIKKIF